MGCCKPKPLIQNIFIYKIPQLGKKYTKVGKGRMIPQIQPWIGEEEVKSVYEQIKSGWISEGQRAKEFEEEIKKLTGAKHAISCMNGTIALFIAIKALGIGRGDEVIVPDMTFIATANAAIMAGAVPVFCDIDRGTFNLSPTALRAKISERTKAIIPVHLYGQSAAMHEIMAIAKASNLFVIEDAAEALGVKLDGKHVGTFGNMGTFSFYANKNVTTGEGGMVITNDDRLALKAQMLKNHGRKERGSFVHDKIGYNFSFTDIGAAIGLAQLRKFPEVKRRKSSLLKEYRKQLEGVKQVSFPKDAEGCEPVIWFISVLVENPGGLQEYLKTEGIETRRFFYPLHRQPCYKGWDSNEFPDADWAYEHGLSLPSSATLTKEEVTFVCTKIREFFRA